MGGRDGDLEVLVPFGDEEEGEGTAASLRLPAREDRRTAPWRRGAVVAVAAVFVAVAIGLPLRQQVARSEFRWLDRRWAEAMADDSGQEIAVQELMAYLPVSDGPDDVAVVNVAIADVYREEQQRLDTLRARLHRSVLVDSRVIAIRSAIVTELAHRATLLAELADWYATTPPVGTTPPFDVDKETVDDIVRVEHDLATARAHWNEPAEPQATAAPYAGATKALARFSHWLDQPTGATLVAASGDAETGYQLLRFDVDASRMTATGTYADLEAVLNLVMRPAYLAFLSGGEAWAVATNGSGAPRLLASNALSLFPAADPAAVWVVSPKTLAATEIDGNGRVMAGPLSAPGVPIAATAGALIDEVAPQPRLAVWSLTSHRIECRLVGAGSEGDQGTLLATSANLVAWVDGADVVHVTDVSTCTETFRLALPIQGVASAALPSAAAFSPDGSRLAVSVGEAGVQDDEFPLLLVDLASGRTTTIPTEPYYNEDSLVWTADGTRLFWIYNPGNEAILATWKVGDSQSHILRVPDLDITAPLLVVP